MTQLIKQLPRVLTRRRLQHKFGEPEEQVSLARHQQKEHRKSCQFGKKFLLKLKRVEERRNYKVTMKMMILFLSRSSKSQRANQLPVGLNQMKVPAQSLILSLILQSVRKFLPQPRNRVPRHRARLPVREYSSPVLFLEPSHFHQMYPPSPRLREGFTSPQFRPVFRVGKRSLRRYLGMSRVN